MQRASAMRTGRCEIRLPETMKGDPMGPVCLYIKLPSQKILPIRRSDGKGNDTARFRDESWEIPVVKRTQNALRRAEVDAIKAALDTKDRDIAAQTEILARKNWQSMEACQAIATPQLHSTERPFDVLDPSQQEDIARRVCISRVVWARDVANNRMKEAKTDEEADAAYVKTGSRVVVLSPTVGAFLLKVWQEKVGESDPDLRSREVEFSPFKRDWDKWAASADDYKKPHFGGYRGGGDFLFLQLESQEADARVMQMVVDLLRKNPHPTYPSMEDIAGFFGGSMEAYSRCVVDGQKQLQTKYQSWLDLQTKTPELNKAAHDELVAACQRGVTTLSRLKEERKTLADQLALDQKALSDETVVGPVGGGP